MRIKRLLSALTAAVVWSCAYLPLAMPASFDTVYAESTEMTYTVNKDANHLNGTDDNGFSYDVLLDVTGGVEKDIAGSMIVRNDGGLKIDWDAEPDMTWFEADYGYKYDSGKKAMKMGKISIDYDAEQSAVKNGNCRMGVHGWMKDPLVEFYIIDNWENWRPSDERCRTIVIDGGEYDIFRIDHYPVCILTSADSVITQYFSVRKQKRTSGTINVSEHFKAWEQLGWTMGDLYSVNFNVAGWESKGSADIKKLKINAPKPVTTTTTTTTTTAATTETTTTTSATTSQETSTTTTDTVTDDDKKYVEVVNKKGSGKGEVISPYSYFYNAEKGYMYAAEDGCFYAGTEAGEHSVFYAGIEKPDTNLHKIGDKPVTADYKFENTFRDKYQLSYHLTGSRDHKDINIYVVENSRNFPVEKNLPAVQANDRMPKPPEAELIKTYTANGHEYDLYKEECVDSGHWAKREYETYIAVRKDQEEGTSLESSVDIKEHISQIDEKLADEMMVRSLVCAMESEMSEGTIKVQKNDIVFDTYDVPFYIQGDFNFDKVIDSLELVNAKAKLLEWSDEDDPEIYMDLNQDSEYTIADVVMLKSYILGKISSFSKNADN